MPVGWNSSGQPVSAAQWDAVLANNAKIRAEGEAKMRSQRKWENIAKMATVGIVGGGALAGAMGAGGAAGAAASSGAAAPTWGTVAGTTSGGAAGATSAASGLPWMQIGGKAVDTLFGIYGNRQQSRANRDALTYQQNADTRAEAIEAQERAEQKRQFDLQQAELRRQWDASQKFEADKFAASEEERLYNRRLADEREVRRQPYRDASAAALARMPGLLASGRTSPGMGSLGSYRGR